MSWISGRVKRKNLYLVFLSPVPIQLSLVAFRLWPLRAAARVSHIRLANLAGVDTELRKELEASTLSMGLVTRYCSLCFFASRFLRNPVCSLRPLFSSAIFRFLAFRSAFRTLSLR